MATSESYGQFSERVKITIKNRQDHQVNAQQDTENSAKERSMPVVLIFVCLFV